MASRNLTDKFKSIRGEIVTQRVAKSDSKEYIEYFAKMDSIISDIKKLQKDWKILYGKLQMAVFDGKSIEKSCKDKLYEIDLSVNNLRKMFDAKKTIYGNYSDQDFAVVNNMFKHKLTIFEGLIIEVQNEKMQYKRYIESQRPQTDIDKIIKFGVTQRVAQRSQIFESTVDENILAEREQEIIEIVKSIEELAQLFKDLSLMINSQSEVIERIDIVMKDTVEKVDGGVGQIQKAEREQKKCVIQ